MEKEIKIKVHNSFEFIKSEYKTGEILGKYKAENIILNNFWAKYLSTTSKDCLKYVHFGSGTTTPQATDIKLTQRLGYKTAPVYNAADTVYDFSRYYSDGIMSVSKRIRIEYDEYVGETISEVGFSAGTSGTTGLLTKAIIKDENGDPAPITKGYGDVIDIVGTFYVVLNDKDYIFFGNEQRARGTAYGRSIIYKLLCHQYSFDSTNYTAYTQGRVQPQYNSENANIPTSYSPGNASATYDTNNKKIVFSVPNITAANGNTGSGFRGLIIGGILIDIPCTGFTQPAFIKEVVGTGDGSTTDFQTKFGYIKNNGTAKVYVNDVETAATIDYDQLPPMGNIVSHLKILDYKKSTPDSKALERNLLLGSTNQEHINNDEIEVIAENPFYQKVGIDSFRGGYIITHMSNDLENWVLTTTHQSISTKTVDSDYRNYKYIKVTHERLRGSSISYESNRLTEVNSTDAAALTNIHLNTAPAEGDVVAVTYQPDCIAKDDQHTINNVKLTLSFSEGSI